MVFEVAKLAGFLRHEGDFNINDASNKDSDHLNTKLIHVPFGLVMVRQRVESLLLECYF